MVKKFIAISQDKAEPLLPNTYIVTTTSPTM